jgi:hypothetical protein
LKAKITDAMGGIIKETVQGSDIVFTRIKSYVMCYAARNTVVTSQAFEATKSFLIITYISIITCISLHMGLAGSFGYISQGIDGIRSAGTVTVETHCLSSVSFG